MGSAQSSSVSILGPGALEGASLVRDPNASLIEFLVTDRKQPNYLRYCDEVVLPRDPISTVNLYTEHTNNLYAKVNLSLASDSPVLRFFFSRVTSKRIDTNFSYPPHPFFFFRNHGEYVKQLRASILELPCLEDSSTLLYRGVDLSSSEIHEMEKLSTFFIPSFTSASVDRDKAYSKSTLLVIKTPFCCKYACSVTEKLSKYFSSEREVLVACYAAFNLERRERVNNTDIITLYLDDYLSVHNNLVYCQQDC
eukprot:TRINITY_DN7880_c0_g1_i1.p1 TRINITY_DN7880_c0_g1~~TRINITY_DN7880_c0_g1_i1.p1  ORF type:complete len:252 (-),score=39.12 TRINITY_DN7880_c0_g1_i1:128-883(-)